MSNGANNPENTTQANTAAPENNLALRYSYEQLDATHRAMADRVTALIVAYPDIVRLNDPAKQRDLIQEVMNSPIGHGAGEAVNTADGLANQIPVLRDVLGVARNSQRAAQGAGDAVHAGAVGISTPVLPLTMTAEGAEELYNQLKVIGNNLTEEQARSLGTAYASVFQARRVDREARGIGAAFSSFDNALAYGAASFAWAWDLLRQIPILGPLLQKLDTSPTRSFEDHVRRATNDADVKATREQLTQAGEINGVDTRHWAEALTHGATQQNRAGQDVEVLAPTKDDPVPTAPTAPQDAQGRPLVAPADPLAVGQDALNKASSKAGTNLAEHFRDIDTPQEWALVLGGLGVAGYGVARFGPAVAQGVGRAGVSVARTAVVGTTGLAAGLVQGTSDLIPGGKSGQFRAAEDALRMAEMRRDARQANVEVRQARVDDLQAKPAAERTLADRAALKIDETRLATAQRSLHAAEETVTTATAKVADRAEIGASIVEQGGQRAGRVQVASAFTETAGRLERMGDAASAAISRFANSRLGIDTAEVAVRATRIGRFARFAGRMIPGVGLLGTGAALFMRPTDANAAEYGDANYWQRLDRDRQRGIITDAEYASYRSLQTAFLATGAGGFITAGVTEAVQNGGEHLDRERMSRYMPPSLVETVREMVDERQAPANDGALGRTDPGVGAAAVAATQASRAAQREASAAARPLVRSQVVAVVNRPEGDEQRSVLDNLRQFNLNKMDIRRGDWNPLS